MKAAPAILLLCASLAFADVPQNVPADRTQIEQVIHSPSTAKAVSALFTAGANEPLSEVTPPLIVIQSIRFITPQVALVDAVGTQFGSAILTRRVPVWLVMKKEGDDWKIAALKLPVPSDFV